MPQDPGSHVYTMEDHAELQCRTSVIGAWLSLEIRGAGTIPLLTCQAIRAGIRLISKMYRISLCTCEKVAEKGRPWGPFSAPFPPEPNPPSGRFNRFLGSGAPSAQRVSTADCCSRFRHP